MNLSAANLLSSVVNFSNRTGQLVDGTLAFDVHEVDFGLIEKEMIVQRGDAETVIQRG